MPRQSLEERALKLAFSNSEIVPATSLAQVALATLSHQPWPSKSSAE
jgi:hypothetical protein